MREPTDNARASRPIECTCAAERTTSEWTPRTAGSDSTYDSDLNKHEMRIVANETARDARKAMW